MIKLSDIKGHSALELLRAYNGKNPYILNFRDKLKKQGKLTLTENQSNYIIDNISKDPILIDRVVGITEYLGEELKNKYELKFTPERILIQFILAETEKTFHIYGKLKKNQKQSNMYFIPKTQILDDPYFEEIDIDVDFEKYQALDQFILDDGSVGRVPYEHQKEGIKFLLTRDGCILADDMGLGKCLITSELAYTPNGKVKMGDLKVGDYVIGSNGKKTKVLEVHPQPKKELFKITFNDGYSTVCCKEHMWTVTSNNGSVNNKNRPVRYTNLTIEQMLDKNLEIEQRGFGWNEKRPYKFKTYYKQSNGQNKWQIPIVKPIEFENEYKLLIEHYLLGVSLADGYINKSGVIKIELHKDDFDEIFNNQILNEISSSDNKRCNYISLLKEEICNLKLNGTLSHTKFIPDIYKYSSIDDRLSILQGLMDTDGHCMLSKNNTFNGTEYCTVSEQLADDVAEIVHSLGGIVRKKTKIGSYKKEDGTRVICKKAYRLNIKLPEGMNPFRLKRKAKEYNPPKKYKVGRYIKDITSIGLGDSVCIKVDAEDSLFTLNHAIVTHNTYQAIIAALESGAERILIVCPSGVKINWEREINYFQETNTSIIKGHRWNMAKFVIINYDILKNFHAMPSDKLKKEHISFESQHIAKSKFDLCIIDEAHYLKNHKSIRGSIMQDICVEYGIKKVWLLSGTPIANRPMDYYNLLKLIKAPIADNWMFFAKRYCNGRQITTKQHGKTRKIWLTDGNSNLSELSSKTKNIILRRLKSQIEDMPEKIIIPIYHELNSVQSKDYDLLWEDYIEERRILKKKGKPDKNLVELGLLRKYIAMQSISESIDLAENIIDQGHKVIIFTNFTDELLEFSEHFKNKAVLHYGQMNDNEKQKSLDRFQKDDKVKIFIGNIKSAGIGITLTKATYVIFNSLDWVPSNVTQAIDRAYRIGQKNNVTVYFNLFKDTVDERVWKTLFYKSNIINTILDTGEENIFISETSEKYEEIIDLIGF